MVADKVTVISRAFGSGEAYKWESGGANGYAISPAEKAEMGTEVILKIKADAEDENYSDFLDEHRVRSLVKKYSDFIRYPIKMTVTKSRLKEGSDSEYETYREDEVLNSMVPIWRRNKASSKEGLREVLQGKALRVTSLKIHPYKRRGHRKLQGNTVHSKRRALRLLHQGLSKGLSFIQAACHHE